MTTNGDYSSDDFRERVRTTEGDPAGDRSDPEPEYDDIELDPTDYDVESEDDFSNRIRTVPRR